jgi:hypothetical protein
MTCVDTRCGDTRSSWGNCAITATDRDTRAPVPGGGCIQNGDRASVTSVMPISRPLGSTANMAPATKALSATKASVITRVKRVQRMRNEERQRVE